MITNIEIKGYKSIINMELELRPINILIGSNGVGKSNFISFFKLLRAILKLQLQRFIIDEKADNLLYFGRKTTEYLDGKIIFSNDGYYNNAYNFRLAQTKEGGMFIDYEGSGFKVSADDNSHNYFYNYSIDESQLQKSSYRRDKILTSYLTNVQSFHFHDTSSTSWLRKGCSVEDNRELKGDGRNLPAFLLFAMILSPFVVCLSMLACLFI